MTDLEVIKAIFNKAGWGLEETHEQDGSIVLEIGGYYGIEVPFKSNGDIEID